jgi:hypothetical protein
VRPSGLFVVQIRADIPDVRVGQADDLPCVTRIGENFLITGEAGVENDFAAPARDRAGRAAVKDAPVFERKCGWTMLYFQCRLPAVALTLACYLEFASAVAVDNDPKCSTGQYANTARP